MIALFFARRRLRKANAAFRDAYDANVAATERQDTRAMHETRAELRRTQSTQTISRMAGVSMYDVSLILSGDATPKRAARFGSVPDAPASSGPLVAQKGATGRAPFPFTEAHVWVLERCARQEISQNAACELIGCSTTALRNALYRMRSSAQTARPAP